MTQGIDIVQHVKKIIHDKKGENIVAFDVQRRSPITDYIVIVSGNSIPHLRGMADAISREMKTTPDSVYRISGAAESGWIILDLIDVVVHLFMPRTREHFSLEEIWDDCPKIM